MEKRRLHYTPELVRQIAADPVRTKFTRAALDGANELGMSPADIRKVIAGLGREDFFKSMTTHADAAVWQDVYRPTRDAVPLYIKLTVYGREPARRFLQEEVGYEMPRMRAG